ncbi:MAG TPA: FHA domain-containing protein [Solirubrobacteraceae bacterium]
MKEAAPSLGPQPSSPEEMERWRVAKLYGDPYLMYRTRGGRLELLSLPGSWEQINIGRSPGAEISLAWDGQVSAVHALLERAGDDWVLVDDGLSRNGSFVNGEKIMGRRRLLDGDELRFGRTTVLFHAPLQVNQSTVVAPDFGS